MHAVVTRDEILALVAQHVVENNYRYSGSEELKLLASNKLGHDLDDKDVKIVERKIKEIRKSS